MSAGTDLVAHFVLDGRLMALLVRDGRATVEALAPWVGVQALLSRVLADLDALSGPRLATVLRTAVARTLRHDLARPEPAGSGDDGDALSPHPRGCAVCRDRGQGPRPRPPPCPRG